MSAREPNEPTQAWLERLIGMNAPADVSADVRAILEAETRLALVPPAGINPVEDEMMTERFEIRSDLALVKSSVGASMLHYNLVGIISRKVRNRNSFLTEIIATGTKTKLHEFEKGLPFLIQRLKKDSDIPMICVTRVDNVDYDDVKFLKTDENIVRDDSSGADEYAVNQEFVQSMGSEKSKSHSTSSYVEWMIQAFQNYMHHNTGIGEEKRITQVRIFIEEKGQDSSVPVKQPFVHWISSDTESFDFLADLFPGKTIISHSLRGVAICAEVSSPRDMMQDEILVVETA